MHGFFSSDLAFNIVFLMGVAGGGTPRRGWRQVTVMQFGFFLSSWHLESGGPSVGLDCWERKQRALQKSEYQKVACNIP